MTNDSIREALDKLRQSPKPELAAVADALDRYLDTEDPAALGLLLPMEQDYALGPLGSVARESDNAETRRVLDFVMLAMGEGEAAFPVARSKYEFPSTPKQTAAEDFAASLLNTFLGTYGTSPTEASDRRLLEAAERNGVKRERFVALFLAQAGMRAGFGWSTVEPAERYMGWGLNVANNTLAPPHSATGWGALEQAVWDLDDNAMLALLRTQTAVPVSRYGPFSHRFGKLHGALALLRPAVIERFLADASPELLATLSWSVLVRATGAFDRQAIGFAQSLPGPEALRLLVLIDTLRPGTCTDEALARVFSDETIPDESGLCYVRDRQPDRLVDYLSRTPASPDKWTELTQHTLRTSYRELARHWGDGGREVALAILGLKLVPLSSYSDGRASLQGLCLAGLLEAETSPPAADLRECLALAEHSVEKSGLDSKVQLESRRYFYLAVVAQRPEALAESLWTLLEDRSKLLRDIAIEGLAKLPKEEVLGRAVDLLGSGKADIRGSAASLLGRIGGAGTIEALGTALETESSDKVRSALHAALEACGIETAAEETGSPVDFMQLLAEIERSAAKLKLPKSSVSGLADLPVLHWTDGHPVSPTVVTFLIAKQAKHKVIAAAPDLAPLLPHVDRKSSGDFALHLVEGFLNSDQAASDRWALTLGGLLGDKRIIPPLLSRIQGWCENSRHKLAEYAAQAISLLPGDEPLMVLDTLATRYRSKFKNVGKACAAAFEAAATARGITPDELGDMVVPRFEFDDEGVRRFEWEGGGVSAGLAPDFKLEWFDPETDKSWKSLPAAVPDAVKSEVKTLNKLIRETVKGQTARLELSLVRQRRWPVDRWRELYGDHPILRSFASRLVWGIYDASGSLLRTFRRYPNGLLADAAGGLEELEESDTTIGMVHPLELDDAALDAWRAHLGRMKVKPPFPQLDRPVERLDPLHANRRELSVSRGKQVGVGTFRSRSEKRGWVRGSVIDGGGISSVYKPYPGAGIEAILPTGNYYIGIDPMDTLSLESAYFVKGDSVERGSYTYDEPGPDDPRVLPFNQVPDVVFSETVADLKAIVGEGA